LSENKSSLVASFMAILELLKAGRITLEEKEDGEILVTLNTRKVKNNDTE